MGPLCRDTASIARDLAPRVGVVAADALETLAAGAARDAAPVLVVVGPVSSGKSTLVNALVGRRVAPTGAGECTRLVARYVRGPADRLDVVLTDGSRRPLPLAEGGRVPAGVSDRLGVPPDAVDHLLVTLTSDALEGMTLVDTPGTGSARARPAAGAGRGPVAAGVGAADAALVVLPAGAGTREVADLAEQAGPDGPVGSGPVGLVTVLGRADTVEDADAVAAGLGRTLGQGLGPVSPVIGLLAETAVTGALRTEDLHTLGVLAGLDPVTLELALLPDGPPLPRAVADPVALTRLRDLLDRHGVRLGVDLLRRRPDAGVGDLSAVLLAASGLDGLVARLHDEVRSRADLLVAATAARRLGGLVAELGPRDGALVADAAEELGARPARLEGALLAARARVRAGVVDVPDDLRAELDRLAAGGPAAERLGRPGRADGELGGLAARRAAAWRSWSSWGTPRGPAAVAHTVHRAYVALWRELTA